MKNIRTSFQTIIVLIVLTGSALTILSQESKTPSARPEDDAAIRENVKQMESGWNTKSGASFAKPFAEDADYVVINGMHIRGQEAIEKGHQQIFDTIYKNTTLSLTVNQIRLLRPDVALVHVSGHRDAPETKRVDATIVMVMIKDGGKWKIASFQNTQVSGPPPK